jgi:hypothetical protein
MSCFPHWSRLLVFGMPVSHQPIVGQPLIYSRTRNPETMWMIYLLGHAGKDTIAEERAGIALVHYKVAAT